MAVPNDPVIDALVKAANNSSHAIGQLQKGKISHRSQYRTKQAPPVSQPVKNSQSKGKQDTWQ